MDEATKVQLKWRFYRLAIILNAIVLLVALGVVALLKLPGTTALAAGLVLFVLAVILGIYFRMKYTSTRRWLDEQA
ncbi:MAG: hypothetical protein MUC66_05330 [Methanolinea sp.]|jgi:uncharacterized membrane protein YhhN|nr:hypothetical protein [Methanolinea sp.]